MGGGGTLTRRPGASKLPDGALHHLLELVAAVRDRDAVPVPPAVIELVTDAPFDGEVAGLLARGEVLEGDAHRLHDDHPEVPAVVDVAGQTHEGLDPEAAAVQARVHDDGGVAEPVPEVGVVGHDEPEHLLGAMGAHDELAQHAGIELLEEFVVARRRATEAPLERDVGVAGEPVQRRVVLVREHPQVEASRLQARGKPGLVATGDRAAHRGPSLS